MCGILGVVGPASERVDPEQALQSLAHRGRDHTSVRKGPGFALGYCRLAIREVGDRAVIGHQPFEAPKETWFGYGVGEVYNAEQLRAEYCGVKPGGDIGGILAAYLMGGPQGLEQITGEFACSLFDPATGQLVLGRDHVGTRGLFYAERGSSLYFASEVKGLAALGVALRPDATTVASYLRFNYPLAPRTWYEGITSVPAGSALLWSDGRTRILPFADVGDLAAEQLASPLAIEVQDVHRLLATAVESRARSDVELGQHLSGGLDSSIIAGLGDSLGRRAYTVDYAWDRPSDDQRDRYWAGEVARQVGLDWRFVPVTTREALALVPEVIAKLDGPLMSPGAVTPYLVARAASADGTKVLLEGQGADEAFLGYKRFREALGGPPRGISEIAANVDLEDLAAVAPSALSAVRQSEETMRVGATLRAEGAVEPLLGLQLAYLRFFLHELLRIEDHVHLAWTIENRPPFLDRAVVRAGLALTVRRPSRALGKHVLRDLLLCLGSRAADRRVKQQMTVAPSCAAAWAVQVLHEDSVLDSLGSFDHGAIMDLTGSARTRSRQRLLWALANLALWARSKGFVL